jgi:hypothetical protein
MLPAHRGSNDPNWENIGTVPTEFAFDGRNASATSMTATSCNRRGDAAHRFIGTTDSQDLSPVHPGKQMLTPRLIALRPSTFVAA